ncbi:MAG: F0F1 ATP synthase subunit epsilon [Candidatus Omnitrophica bacterium]|nr:F0F1 ATP synthase subunit epsilon [Candidatus Omnitrophota bacterium]
MSSYQLTLVTPAGKMFDGPVDFLTAPGSEGCLGILAGHAPLATALKQGLLAVKSEGRERCFNIGSGILETTREQGVLVLCDFAVEKNMKKTSET